MSSSPLSRRGLPFRLPALAAAAALTLGLAAASCRAPGSSTRAIPPWVAGKSLSDEQFVYAVGACPLTSVPADREERAIQNARAELGRVIRTEVHSTTEQSQTMNQEAYQGHSESQSQAVLRESEVVDKWLDQDGLMGSRGTLWVLVRLPRARIAGGP